MTAGKTAINTGYFYIPALKSYPVDLPVLLNINEPVSIYYVCKDKFMNLNSLDCDKLDNLEYKFNLDIMGWKKINVPSDEGDYVMNVTNLYNGTLKIDFIAHKTG